MGTPPIVSRAAGVSELLTDGQNALIVESPVQIATLAAAIRRALDPATHDRLSHGCMESRNAFSYDRHLNAIVELYAAKQRKKTGAP